MLAISNHILIFCSFQDDLPHDLARHQGEIHQYVISLISSLFPFLKMRVMFLLLLSVGTSLHCLDISNMMDSYLATLSTGAFWICGYVSTATMDTSHQLPRTCILSGFFNYLRPGLHLQWRVVIHFLSP